MPIINGRHQRARPPGAFQRMDSAMPAMTTAVPIISLRVTAV